MTTEHNIQSEIVKYLRSKGMLVIRINSGMRGIVRFYWWWAGDKGKSKHEGVADILALDIDGKFYAIEVKKPGEYATAQQYHFLQEVERRGGIAAVVWCVEDVKNLLEDINE